MVAIQTDRIGWDRRGWIRFELANNQHPNCHSEKSNQFEESLAFSLLKTSVFKDYSV
ncbi:hypothetical protein RMSM_00626 [Rhodopirellula maiorica SM1]|uniref:Uncharacterized protein n=1 Tax=Rhodopirellula maiorica SM1 TaxID=1265738 RepID=M5S473_9BACT|nr:hypothetical protein RMSM_00626 [Rhodopirellula maiorica SM1]